ncbi:MAG: hypothetical protein JO212_13000, partial [Acetobacteraceae bacterium]|nr:hypothetical protein [Acetobacteraceae bacterium]
MITAAPQGRGCFLLNHLLEEASHPLAQLRLDRVEPDLPSEQRRRICCSWRDLRRRANAGYESSVHSEITPPLFPPLPLIIGGACDPAAVVLAGDYNVIPTELDVSKPENWLDDALFRPEVRAAFRRLLAQGWTDALRCLHPDERIYYTFWDYFRNADARNAGLRIDHRLLAPSIAGRLREADADRARMGKGKRSSAYMDRIDGSAGPSEAYSHEEASTR